MEIWKRNLWLLWVGCFITSASFSMVIPFLPLFLLHIGVSENIEMWSGLLFSSAFFAGAISSPYWGALGDKYGRKPMIIRAGFVLCVIYLLTSMVTSPYQLLILRLLQGLLSGFIPGSIALVGTNTPEKHVGYALSMMSTSTATGSIMGPLMGGLISKIFDSRVAFASAGVFVLCSTLLVLFWVNEEKFVPSKDRSSIIASMKMAVKNKPFVTVLGLTLLTQFSVMTIEPVLPLYIVQIGGSAKDASLMAGIIFSLVGIASILFAPRWGKLADKIGFHKILVIGLFVGGLGNLAQIMFHGIWGFSIVRFIYGAFFCAVFPALNGLVVRTTPADFRGRAFGLNQTASQLGGMLGPLVGGAISGVFSIHSVFLVTGLLLLLAMGAAYWSKDKEMQPS
ncbi:MFS transporter [Paenibacillus doosanensis]|uniref:Tetracycline resistance protein, class B n=1 Tax=Paenibacillus konkukensis TaxID=2020716 RepID=A0ABY4RXQ3_9BACL|nr:MULTISPECIES: MFS transporter [Paenibacillus]MCS7460899.1 MFS transporter [Paenibacillus doosanensis]UQZ86323.1 Tetracycline resistance protein, class B [Paenibacillus konkukensis]